MLKVRFYTDAEDPRPVNWPIKHPYWVTGETASPPVWAIVVAYVDDRDELFANWPDAKLTFIQEVQAYEFTDRFPAPEWFRE